ncbi:hypothetical protein EJB05_24704, partial [Eragrostis curvula]
MDTAATFPRTLLLAFLLRRRHRRLLAARRVGLRRRSPKQRRGLIVGQIIGSHMILKPILWLLWSLIHLMISFIDYWACLTYKLQCYLISSGPSPKYQYLRHKKLKCLGVAVDSSETKNTMEVKQLLHWFSTIGIKYVALYDIEGVLKKSLQLGIEGSEDDNSRNSLDVCADAKTSHCSYRGMIIEHLSVSDGKEGIAKAANFLYSAYCDSRTHGYEKHNIVFTEADMASALRSVGCGGPEPDLLLVYGPVRCHLGFPPWRLRYTEIVHMGPLKSMKYASIVKVLYQFSKKHQNYAQPTYHRRLSSTPPTPTSRAMRSLLRRRAHPAASRLLSTLAGGSNGGGTPRAGVVYGFGDNSHGAVGQPAPAAASYVPTPVPSLPPSVSGVAGGHYHSLAVSAEGEVWAWGRNDEGQLGRGLNSPRNTWSNPEQVRGLENVQVRAVSASGVVSAAIGHDGSLWVWGRSKRGQLGLGKDVIEALVPSRVEALASYDVVKVSFGWGHAMALTKDGKLFGWGYSENGRLGEIGQSTRAPSAEEYIGKTEDKYSRSMLEAVEKMVEEKIRSEDNMPIIWEPSLVHEVTNGVILSGGDNTYGQLGRKPGLAKLLPVDMSHRPFSVSASVGHSLALCQISTDDADGVEPCVLSWGWNNSSQLGRPGPEDVPSLVDCLRGEKPVSASAGRVHSIALTSKGEVWAWGSGLTGRLGLGSSIDEPEPCLVDTLEGVEVLQVAAGMDHNLVVVSE